MLASSLALLFSFAGAGIIGQSATILGSKVLVCGGWSDEVHSQLRTARNFDPDRSSWSQVAPLPISFVFSSMVSYQGRAVLIGGITPDLKHSKEVHSFNATKHEWAPFPPLPKPVSRVASCVWQGTIFISGGYNGTSDREKASNDASLLKWDPKAKKWTYLTPMPTPRHAHCLIPFQGRLWAIGGFGNDPAADVSVESYDRESDSWRKEARLPSGRGFFGAGVVAEKLVVFGGSRSPSKALEWSQSGWKERPSNDLALRRFAYVQQGKDFLIFGGEPNGKEMQTYRP